MAIRDTVLPVGGGPDGKSPIFIKARTPVNYSVSTMHRRKDLYGEDADEFKPERWAKLRQGYVNVLHLKSLIQLTPTTGGSTSHSMEGLESVSANSSL